jgi:sterol 3beta-glucosyltransferase/vancomycin aglycone glucosyltransferase
MTDELTEGLDDFLSAGSPPVYLTFGSMMLNDLDYIRETAAIWMNAVRQVGSRAIFQFPCDALSEFRTDDRFFTVQRSPYQKVFPRCSLVVHHGGSGTTQSALLAGAPSIIVAHLADQFFWGSELERLGVAGRTLKRKGLRANRLAAEISRTLGRRDMAARARALGERMAQEDGVATAIALISKKLLAMGIG